MMSIDLNCDLGEGFPNDERIMPFISSANIACGYHAGDEKTIRATIRLCKRYHVAIGAHPSFNDRENFGRTEIQLPESEIRDIISLQVKWIKDFCKDENAKLSHVKPHGALYNMAAKSNVIAKAVADAVKSVDDQLILFGLSGSHSITEAKQAGLKTASEVFADRTYQDDGNLTPRSRENALITDENKMLEQVMMMIQSQSVITLTGNKIPLNAETLCLHGDGDHAVKFAASIYNHLQKNQIVIKAI